MAAVLLLAGGLQALQTAALASALPFAVVMLFIGYGLLRALQTESQDASMDLSSAPDASPSVELSWQQRLASITGFYDKPEIAAFLAATARPAIDAVAAQFRESGLAPQVAEHEGRVELDIPHGDRGQFRYTVRARSFRAPSFAWTEAEGRDADSRHYRAMAAGPDGEQQHDVTGYTQEQLINDLLKRYARFRQLRRIP